MEIKFVRLYADAAGESHFADVEEPLARTDFAPPAAPLHLSALQTATQVGFFGAPAGWVGQEGE